MIRHDYFYRSPNRAANAVVQSADNGHFVTVKIFSMKDGESKDGIHVLGWFKEIYEAHSGPNKYTMWINETTNESTTDYQHARLFFA